MRLLYILRPGRLARLRQPPDSYPSELFYGYLQLARREGFEAELAERASPSWLGQRAHRLVHFFTHLAPELGNLRGLSRELLLRHDAIVSVAEPVLLTLALRKRDREDGAKLVLVFIGGEKRLVRSRLPGLTRRLLRLLFERCAAVIVVGEGERRYLVENGLADSERVHLVRFGVDAGFWSPGPEPDTRDFALAIGNDDGRDYATLLAAIGDHPLRLHTQLPLASRGLPANVRLTRGDWHGQTLSDAEVRELYRQARLVVTPLRESAQPSGQSVTLQAMACGKPVIVSRTRGLWSPELMRHDENCWLVPAGDAAALRSAIERLSGDAELRGRLGAAARASVERHFTADAMADAIARVLERAVAR